MPFWRAWKRSSGAFRLTELLALSFDSAASPSITLKSMARADDPLDEPYGWGFAWYPTEDYSALVLKDPTSLGDNAMSQVLRDWERFQSTIFACYLRGASKRTREQDMQPFWRSYAARDWVMAHNGQLVGDLGSVLDLGSNPLFEPNGSTDSEHAFCWVMNRIHRSGARRLADVGWAELHEWLRRIETLGTANLLLTDGQDLVVYHDSARFNGLHWIRKLPPHEITQLETDQVLLDLGDAYDLSRSVVVFSTSPLSDEAWLPMEPGQMIVARRGVPIWQNGPDDSIVRRARAAHHPAPGEGRRLRVTHETLYRYETAVERSQHTFRLRPVHDHAQEVLEHEVQLSVDGSCRPFQDVFGNHATRVELGQPYTELRIVAKSLVRVRADGWLPDFGAERVGIPPVWMPWQRQMMLPYLLPPELPETMLSELQDFAMSFVNRQEGDLVQTLLDLNESIFRDFAYVSGSTTLETTPFEVYVNRRGVCQDFAQLFICLARMLSIPARYRVGYLYTGTESAGRASSDASHAWVEVYLPLAGWYGLDPTNGCLAGRDHVRVAAGRNYRDATPTSGTLYEGGDEETLRVKVSVEET